MAAGFSLHRITEVSHGEYSSQGFKVSERDRGKCLSSDT
jgi:hypothetical protein